MNKNKIILSLLTFILIIFSSSVSLAKKREVKGKAAETTKSVKETAAGCLPASDFRYLDINNVRARINTFGDMWWDGEVGKYEVPKGTGKTSMFSASLWMGGVDVNDQLKLSANLYRYGPNLQGSNTTDFWTGPLTTDGAASVEPETCKRYDEMFYMTREMVNNFVAAYDAGGETWQNYVSTMPDEIKNWPAHGDPAKGQSYYLAPFYDNDGDGTYNPMNGDYPYYDLSGDLCGTQTPTPEEEIWGTVDASVLSDQVIKGDQTLWWVFNDKGNTHTNTEGTPIGVEVRAQSFAFSTNDELNSMSFYSYEIINRSTFALRDTYFSQWVDPDLGWADDDYTGCDVERGLGYVYNGDEFDGTGQPFAYGENPPAVGVDFFQGPYIDDDGEDNPDFTGDCSVFDQNAEEGDANDGSAINGINFGDGIVDNERYGMRRFVYHSREGDAYQTDPDYAIEYYNYLKGIWKDGQKMIYGANAHPANGAYGPVADFMFPGETDPCNWGVGEKGFEVPNGPKNWTEKTAGNPVADRRFMQSAGPFTLEAGAVNYITVGIPWARAQRGGAEASLQKLKAADDKAQALFENCFQVVNGPNAPDLTIQELDQKLIVYITNRKVNSTGNNYKERYEEIDPAIVSPDSLSSDERYDSTYNFEGYKIYQLASPSVTSADFDDPDLAKLVFQCDIKNGVSELINYEYNADLDADVPVMKVDGADNGISHSFVIEEDAFTNGSLVNHKQYYFKAVAYGYNNYLTYNPDPESQTANSNFYGQKLPYLEGRSNIKTYTGIPHKNVSDMALQSEYGDGVSVTRLQGVGNGGNYLKLTDEVYAEIMEKSPFDTSMSITDEDYPIVTELSYQQGYSPLNIKVIDPFNVKNGEYAVIFDTLKYHVFTNITQTPNVIEGGDNDSIAVTNWYLKDLATGDIFESDTTIIKNNEQLFLDLGISVELKQVYRPGTKAIGLIDLGNNETEALFYQPAQNNGFIGGEMFFEDTTKRWLTGVADNDNLFPEFNWIKAGNEPVDPSIALADAGLRFTDEGGKYPYDPNSVFEKVLNGTWAPYKMVALMDEHDAAPGYKVGTQGVSRVMASFDSLASVDVIITNDSTKWTRCPVVEMSPNEDNAENGAERLAPRLSPSVNIHGEAGVESDNPLLNSNYIDSVGMSWFPGYAINVETGERLNMAFGEDSWLEQDNGRDMMWNPSARLLTDGGEPVLGGKHYVYVFGHQTIEPQKFSAFGYKFYQPPYDAGKAMKVMLDSASFTLPPSVTSPREFVYATALWVTLPIPNPTEEWMSTDVKVELRVNKPYQAYNSGFTNYAEYNVPQVDLEKDVPLYKFSTEGVAPVPKEKEEVKDDLDLITVVPNPYYGYSTYEQDQLDNRVKLVNLPEQCTISIYNVSGTLVRQFKKDDLSTQLDWDLKNFAGIPIAGGVYYIHVKAPDKGEQIVKWFGALRPIDLNAF